MERRFSRPLFIELNSFDVYVKKSYHLTFRWTYSQYLGVKWSAKCQEKTFLDNPSYGAVKILYYLYIHYYSNRIHFFHYMLIWTNDLVIIIEELVTGVLQETKLNINQFVCDVSILSLSICYGSCIRNVLNNFNVCIWELFTQIYSCIHSLTTGTQLLCSSQSVIAMFLLHMCVYNANIISNSLNKIVIVLYVR